MFNFCLCVFGDRKRMKYTVVTLALDVIGPTHGSVLPSIFQECFCFPFMFCSASNEIIVASFPGRRRRRINGLSFLLCCTIFFPCSMLSSQTIVSFVVTRYDYVLLTNQIQRIPKNCWNPIELYTGHSRDDRLHPHLPRGVERDSFAKTRTLWATLCSANGWVTPRTIPWTKTWNRRILRIDATLRKEPNIPNDAIPWIGGNPEACPNYCAEKVQELEQIPSF